MRSTLLWAMSSFVIVAAGSAGAAVEETADGVLFTYDDPLASSVHLAGAFNEWNTTATPLDDSDGDGVWSVVLDLPDGSHEYKFVVNGGTWVADPDNPLTGGEFDNSIVQVGGGATTAPDSPAPPPRPATGSGTPRSNTSLNSRVHIGGFFRMLMEGASDVEGDNRLRLSRPDDQFNLDVTVNLSEKLWGSIRLQLETGEGGPNELATELYKAQSNFSDENFHLKAFYNEEAYSTDDPFELMGHVDLRGTIREEHRPFGQGTQGILLRMQPFGGELDFFYTDTFDEDIFNPSEPTRVDPDKKGLNQSTGTDILVGRATRLFGDTRLGLTYRGEYNDWWVNFTTPDNPDYPDELDEHRASQIRERDSDRSDNFEIANDRHTTALDASLPVPSVDNLQFSAAGAWVWYESRWDLGNRDSIQGTGFVNGPIDVPIGNEGGYRGEAQLEHEVNGLRTKLSHEVRWFQGMDPDESFVAYRTTPGSVTSDRDVFADSGIAQTYLNVNGSDAVDVLRLGPRPTRVNHITEFDAAYDWNDWSVELEVDRQRDNLDYKSFFGGASSSLDRSTWRTSPRLAWRPFESPDHFLGIEGELLTHDDPSELETLGALADASPTPGQGSGSLLRMDSTELLFRGLLPAGQLRGRGLSFAFDLRWIGYDGANGLVDAEDNEVDLDGDFFAPFAALVWKPVDAVQVLVGYGVDPTFYDVISPEGWPNGRQQFRDQYLIEQRLDPYNAANVLMAEEALQDRRQFVINAWVKF